MTYDVSLMKGGEEFPSPLAIHGMGYGAKTFKWASTFIYADYEMPFNEVKEKGKEFHKLFVEYCQSIMHDDISNKNYFGGNPTGYYYDKKKIDEDSITKFQVCLRWLQIYLTAMAFECDINFH